MDFNKVWDNILQHEGENFKTASGLDMTYTVNGDTLTPSRADFKVDKKSFECAYNALPMSGPSEMPHDVIGSTYVYAILADKRIIE